MTTYLKILFSGFAISFIGALPFGTINLTALQLAIERGTPDGIYFAVAVVMMELVIVRCLLLLKPIDINGISEKWHVYVLSIFALIMFFLSAINAYNIFTPSSTQSISNSTPALPSSFLLGLVISGFNPFQFPYWIGWNSALRSKKLLQETRDSRIFYLTGIGIGTMAVLLLFIRFGQFLVSHSLSYRSLLSGIMALLYAGFAVYLCFQIRKIKFTQSPLKESNVSHN